MPYIVGVSSIVEFTTDDLRYCVLKLQRDVEGNKAQAIDNKLFTAAQYGNLEDTATSIEADLAAGTIQTRSFTIDDQIDAFLEALEARARK